MNRNKIIVAALHLAAGALIKHGWVHTSTLYWIGGIASAIAGYIAHTPAPPEAKQDASRLTGILKLTVALLLPAILLTSMPAAAQTSTNAGLLLTGTNAPVQIISDAALSAGQQVLDQLPVFNSLTNLPTTNFDVAKYEIFIGVENTGATTQSELGGHINFFTNFFAGAELTLGSDSQTISSADAILGVRCGKPTWEIYAGAGGMRNWSGVVATWEVKEEAGYVYRLSSGMNCFVQGELFEPRMDAAPTKGAVVGMNFSLR